MSGKESEDESLSSSSNDENKDSNDQEMQP